MAHYSRRAARITGERTSKPDHYNLPGHRWSYCKKLGEGGQGRAYLFNLIDPEERIVDRVVLKYTDPLYKWDIIQSGPGKGQIKELFLHKDLAPSGFPPEHTYTVPVLAAQRMPWAPDAWRYYTPYYEFGDLHGFIEMQITPIPEPFAWFLFHRLVNAAVRMDNALQTLTSNHPIVHVDLKPMNIFMGAPGSLGNHAPFPSYPPAYIGDFGSAAIASGDHRDDYFVGMCTPGWGAPEICAPNDYMRHTRADWQVRIGSHTNIWQIGFIMLRVLMRRFDHFDDHPWHSNIGHRYRYGNPRDPRAYSDDLVRLVESCLIFEAERRPSPKDLLHAIRQLMPNHTEGMEYWGTTGWFEQQSAAHPPSSTDSTVEGAHAARLAARKRRRRFVAEQIRNGRLRRQWEDSSAPLPPTVHPEDKAFVLDERFTMRHPEGNRNVNLDTWFERPNPEAANYKPDAENWPEYIKDMQKRYKQEEKGKHGRSDDGDDGEEWIRPWS